MHRRCAVLIWHSSDDIILTAFLVKFAIGLVAHCESDCRCNVIDGNALVMRLVAIDFHVKFRLGEFEIRIDHAKYWTFFRFGCELRKQFAKHFDFTRLQYKLHR